MHVHVVAHCRKPNDAKGEGRLPGRYDIRGASAISDQAANVVTVWMNKDKFSKLDQNPNDFDAQNEPCAMIKCDKQRNGTWEGMLTLWHDPASLRFCEDRTSAVQPYQFMTRGLHD